MKVNIKNIVGVSPVGNLLNSQRDVEKRSKVLCQEDQRCHESFRDSISMIINALKCHGTDRDTQIRKDGNLIDSQKDVDICKVHLVDGRLKRMVRQGVACQIKWSTLESGRQDFVTLNLQKYTDNCVVVWTTTPKSRQGLYTSHFRMLLSACLPDRQGIHKYKFPLKTCGNDRKVLQRKNKITKGARINAVT
jgi:hypothetical protein